MAWARGLAPLIAAALLLAGAQARGAQRHDDAYPAVTDARLLDAQHDDGWLMYLRSYDSHGHAPFTQIDTHNVAQLREVFTHRVTLPEGFEAPPIVNGRTMIVTTPLNHVYALDAVTGRGLWEYDHHVVRRELRTVCCDMVNRGVALYGTNAYFVTLDSHVIALDARTGRKQWDVQIEAPGEGAAMTLAPLAVKGKIIVGTSGGEYGHRGSILALDAATGKQIWRRFTVPAPGKPGGDTWPGKTYLHGGGPAWLTGSYDPQQNVLLWGVGNPSPWLSDLRKGRNLYTDCVLALDLDSGAIRWYFQTTPNDSWDYDDTNTPVIVDLVVNGKPRKAYYQAGRNGWFTLVDRTNGKLIYATPFTRVETITGYDRRTGRAHIDESKRPHVGKTVFTCPAFFGGDNWWPYSYDPKLGYAFVPTMKTCMRLGGEKPQPFQAGAGYLDEKFQVEHVPGDPQWGELQAIDVRTGRRVWHFDTTLPWNDGTLSTDGGLVFSGTPDGKFYAFDARTGKVLWMHQLTSGIIGVPMSYVVDGTQYVAVQSGWGGVAPFWGGKKMTPLFRGIPLGGRLYVFALPADRRS